MVDLMPTFVDIGGGQPPPLADGKSFLPLINSQHPGHATAQWRSHTLIEYESIRPEPVMSLFDAADGLGEKKKTNTHYHDCANNSTYCCQHMLYTVNGRACLNVAYRAVRQHGASGQFLYAEFTDFR